MKAKLQVLMFIFLILMGFSDLFSEQSEPGVKVLRSDDNGIEVILELDIKGQSERLKTNKISSSFAFAMPPNKKPMLDSPLVESKVKIEDMGYFRYMKTAKVIYKPDIQESEGKDNLKEISQLISIKFVDDDVILEDREPINIKDDIGFIEAYKALVINFEEAKNWLTKQRSPQEDGYILPEYMLYVKESGIYHVTCHYLKEAGVPVDDIDPTTIQLFNKNVEVPLYLKGESDSSFDSGDYFDFYGIRNTEVGYYYSNWTDYNPYFLRWNIEKGKRIQEVSSLQSGGQYFSDFLFYEHFEENGVYDGMDYGTDGDSWMWETIFAGDIINYTTKEIMIENPDKQSKEEAYIKIAFEGDTTLAHHAVLYLNGTNICDLYWSGGGQYEYPENKDQPPLYFPNNLLEDGVNTFTVELPGDTSAGEIDRVFLNWFEIHYHKTFDAERKGELIFRGNSESKVIQEFKIVNVQGSSFDIYNIIAKQKIVDYVMEENTVDFNIQASNKDWFYCIDDKSKKEPANIVKYNPTGLRSKENGADYLIITTKEFADNVKPLARWREEMGMRVKIACVSDIYTEFGYGLYSAESIRNFTRYAFDNWEKPALSYILLVGDASWDRQMRQKETKYFKKDFVPCYLDPARDDYYAYLTDGDEIPDACIGRFPAEDKTQVIRMVNKVIYYEGFPQAGEWWKNAIFINGEDSDGYYQSVVEDIKKGFFPEGWNFIDIFKGITPETKPYNQMIVDAFSEGGTFLMFQGHGATDLWEALEFFKKEDAQKINNTMKLPMIIDHACHTGRFAQPNMNSMSEYLTAQSKDLSGGIGYWGTSGVSVVGIDTLLTTKLFNNIFNYKLDIIGKAILVSKLSILTSVTTEDEWTIPTYVATHIFLGDPALRLAIPPNPTTVENVQVKVKQDGKLVINWDAPEDQSISDYRIYYSRDELDDFEGTTGISDLVSGYLIGNVVSYTTDDYVDGKYVLFVRSQTEDGFLGHPSEYAQFTANQEATGSSVPFVYGGNVFYDGSTLSFFASVKDNDDEYPDVELYYQGIKTGLKLAPYMGEKTESILDNLYSLQIQVKDIPKGEYLFDLIAKDTSGNKSDLYPYLTLHGWNDRFYLDDNSYIVQQNYPSDLTCNEHSPILLYAGYDDTFISTHFGGNLKITVLLTDPDGVFDIDKIKIYFDGIYTGIDVTQREDFENYSRFGLSIPLDSGIINSTYLFQFVAVDKSGNTSGCWPYLRID